MTTTTGGGREPRFPCPQCEERASARPSGTAGEVVLVCPRGHETRANVADLSRWIEDKDND
jgi:hypothetical protein